LQIKYKEAYNNGKPTENAGTKKRPWKMKRKKKMRRKGSLSSKK
jgi:hypothetical protein